MVKYDIDLEIYKKGLIYFNIKTIFICILIFFLNLFYLTTSIKKMDLTQILVSFIIIILLMIAVFYSFNYVGLGINIYKFNEAIEDHGIVRKIKNVFLSPRFYIDRKKCLLIKLYVNGNWFYMINSRKITLGDDISFVYVNNLIFKCI